MFACAVYVICEVLTGKCHACMVYELCEIMTGGCHACLHVWCMYCVRS